MRALTPVKRSSYVLILLLAFAVQASGQDCSKLASDFRQGVVSLSVEKTKTETGAVISVSGTGFIISPDGYVLTANHVVARNTDTDDVKIYGSVGSIYAQKTELRYVSEDKPSDLALLQFKDSSHLYTPIPLGNPFKVQVGGQLCSLSFSVPLKADYHATTGTLSSRTGQDESAGVDNLWSTQMPSNYGESGAPVLDLNKGGVVALKYGGIVAIKNPDSSKPSEPVQNFNYLIPISLSEPMLRKYVGIALPTAETVPLTSESGYHLEKESGDQQVIPVGGWKNFSVKVVDTQGHPITGAKVAWQTPAGGALTYIGVTNENGISSATNLYTFPSPGTYTQFAILVSKDSPPGFTQADKIISVGPALVLTYQQR